MYTFPTTAPIAVTIDVATADVLVTASDRGAAVVVVTPADPRKKADVRAAEQTEVEFANGILSVVTPKSRHDHSPFGGNPAIQVTIEVPAGSRVTAAAAAGQLRGAGALGACEMSVALGDIVIDEPQDSVIAEVAKGDIRIGEAVRGELRLETSLGDVAVGIRPGTAVRLETDATRGTVRNTIQPVAPTGESVRVYAHSTLGDIIIGHTAAV